MKKGKVLVVEDEEYNALSLTAMLRKLGYSVDRAGDGVSGLDQLRRNRYDVAFIDCGCVGCVNVMAWLAFAIVQVPVVAAVANVTVPKVPPAYVA